MIADSSASLGWMRWLGPMGWIEELRPLRDPQRLALLPIAGLIAVCAGLTAILAARRDLNASVIAERAGPASSTRWLAGPMSLAVRVSQPVALGWLAGIVGYAAWRAPLPDPRRR
jgi:ABC-2 type transport system permease protein